MVSLWAGIFVSPQTFSEVVATVYTEDGDFDPSEFAATFGIDYYDEDFFEANWFGVAERVIKLLNMFSYYEIIVDRFASLLPATVQATANAIILLYNFEYDGHVRAATVRGVELAYLGSVSYR
jgi:hypothetical protein